MISNNIAFLSQNVRAKNNLSKSNTTNPQRIAIKHKFQAKLKQSHMNLFNFINDDFSFFKK